MSDRINLLMHQLRNQDTRLKFRKDRIKKNTLNHQDATYILVTLLSKVSSSLMSAINRVKNTQNERKGFKQTNTLSRQLAISNHSNL